ncbi:MAG: ribonuclease [Candidatus Nanopelagicales bacterium]|nr:ribonuclease [Candidatus Nanopelagicales bacterium]
MRHRSAAALLAVLTLTGCATTTLERTDAGQQDQAVSQYADLAPATATTDLPTIEVADLPPEGIETLELIEADGPFPYDKDGSTFQNREGILPAQPRGFYAEYTVETPGSDDRGARRIVAGDDGSRFYTEDHYSSFEEVVAG